MARLPDEAITRIKQDISLQRIVEDYGITLKAHGKDLMGLCPFHDDKEPSLVITPDKNLWHCLGACNTGGSVIDWVIKTQGVSFRHAVELLQTDPSSLVANRAPVKQSTTPKLDNPFTTAEDAVLLNQVIDYYHAALKKSPEALAYLKQRGLDNPELIDHFKLGFANRTLTYRLPETNRKAGKEIRGQLQRIGILRESGHEHFNGSLIIPVINKDQVQEVYGRKINHQLRKGTPYHLYLSGQHKGVFNMDALRASKEIILCESLIDALTFWCAGFRNVTTSYGINGFTDEMLALFKQHKTERVLIAYDRDDAGDKAAAALAAKLLKEGIDCYRIQFPKKMDANAYALQVTPASKSLSLVIRKAHWLGNGAPPTSAIKTKPKVITTNATNVNTSNTPSAKSNETVVMPEVAEASDARVLPDAPTSDVDAVISDHEITLNLEGRRYRIRGLDKNLSYEQLKINLLVSVADHVHVDQLDLYNARQRQAFIKQASIELGCDATLLKTDVSKLLLTLEALQEENIQQTLKAKDNNEKPLSHEAYESALNLLKDSNLLQRILDDFTRCGVVGEHSNKLIAYIAAVSRKLAKPLAVMVQSSSAAGKSLLMDAVLAMIPKEDKTQYSAMTGQSLFYMNTTELKNKILAISEEEGASNASYALKLLQSEGEVSIASTGKDDTTGELVTKEYRVEGPVMLFMTTTAIDIDEELMNRCLVLSVNETREQTQAIHQIQRQSRTLQGFTQKQQKQTILEQHQNAQRCLKSLAVVNPYADQLTFLDSQTRTRRDHEKYLTLIDAIALLHQYQRQTKTITVDDKVIDYIEVTLADIEVANQLAHEVLGRTLDELPPQTRKLLIHIKTLVTDVCQQQAIAQTDYRFSRKTIRDKTGWSDNQLKVHCRRLEDMEYLLVHRGGRGQCFEYELLYNGEPDTEQAQLMGLIDIDQLKQYYDAKKLGQNNTKLDSSCPQVGVKLGAGWCDENSAQARQDKVNGAKSLPSAKNTLLSHKTEVHHNDTRLTPA